MKRHTLLTRFWILATLGCGLILAPLTLALPAAAKRAAGAPSGAPQAEARRNSGSDDDQPDLSHSEMRSAIERYTVDRGGLNRTYPVSISQTRNARLKQFYMNWLDSLAGLDFNAMSLDGRVDYILFKNHLEYELRQLDIHSKQLAETELLVPFAKTIVELEESRRRMQPIDSAGAAALLTRMKAQIDETRKGLEASLRSGARREAGSENGSDAGRVRRPAAGESGSTARAETNSEAVNVKKAVANRAVATINGLRTTLRTWFGFYNGYDPVFTWWVDEPYKLVDQALVSYAAFLSERFVGVKLEEPAATPDQRPGGERGRGPGPGFGQRPGPERGRTASARPGDSSDIIGDPIGREALLVELASEMIPYTPEELIAIARKELAWCEAEMVKASKELGHGDDWRRALEYVKTLHAEPGKQPDLIRDLALEAIKFMDDHDLVTVPQLARETWRMDMMSPERQLVNPFFTGGETISVSYPTNTMSHEQKLMTMRGNNIHFSRATVHHELIPGHHLQGFMTARYKPYRSLFSTPFWGEGWALYWELLLWDMGFAKTPENRIGMLFWRMHRCARIIFSLSFHLEKMTPQECIDLLVNQVGHERENATAEVRRSFAGNYGPLYQAAYLLGGLQFYAMHKELVDSGKMTNRAFHDAILKENRIPVEMVRAILTEQKLSRDFKSIWRFYR